MNPAERWRRREDNIITIAHRGASGQAPENTLAAFAKALEIGVDAVEMDVRRTREGHLVVIHDGLLDRTTDGKGFVSRKSLPKLRKLDAGSWYHPRFSGERIPTLQEVIDLVKRKAKICIELKVRGIEEEVLKLIEDNGITEDVLILSFTHLTLRRIKEINPEVATGALIGISRLVRPSRQVEKALKAKADVLEPPWNFTTPKLIEEAHRIGMPVIVWTVDDQGRMRRLIEMGVDGIATNYPERLKEVLEKR